MKEQIIAFQTAVLAKKNHVEIESYEFYTHRGDLCKDQNFRNQSQYYGSYGAFTLSLLQKWFREVHKIYVVVEPHFFDINGNCQFCYFIYSRCLNPSDKHSMDINSYPTQGTYEEALEKGLQEAFKYINK